MKVSILFSTLAAIASGAFADQYVQPHVRSDGTFVQGHFKTESNNTRLDNYSTKGNTNPYTGQRGYENPMPSTSSSPYESRQLPRQTGNLYDTNSHRRNSGW